MSFTRAERFDKVSSDTPAPGSYDPKFPDKVIGGALLSKCERSTKTSNKNTAVKKPPSSPLLFRMPNPPKDKGTLPKTSKKGATTFGSVDNLRVNENLESLASLNVKLASQVAKLEEANNVISYDRDEANVQVTELEKKNAELAKNKAELEEKLSDLEAYIKDKNDEVNVLNIEIDMMKLSSASEQKRLEKVIADLRMKNTIVIRNSEGLLVTNLGFQVTIVEMQDHIYMLETELNASEINYSDKLRKKQEDLEVAENSLRCLQIVHANMFGALNVLKERLLVTSNDAVVQENLLKEALIKNAILEEKVGKLDKSLENLLTQNLKEIKEMETNLQNCVDGFKKHATEEMYLRLQITNNVVSQVEDLSTEKEALEKELFEIKKTQTVLQQNLGHKMTELEETKFELLCTTDKLKTVTSALEKKNEEYSQLEKVEAELEAKEKVIKKLRKQLSSVNTGDSPASVKSRSKPALGKENTADNSPSRILSPVKKPLAVNVSVQNTAKQ